MTAQPARVGDICRSLMRKSLLRNYPVLSAGAKKELAGLLLSSDPDCIIGIGIRIYLSKDPDMNELIRELQNLAGDDPEFMTAVIGKQAMVLLCTPLH